MRDPSPAQRGADIETVLSRLQYLQCVVGMCGSRVTCQPPPTNTDTDYLVEIIDKPRQMQAITDVVEALCSFGFDWEGSEHYQCAASTFMSWRRGKINLIVTADGVFAEKHRLATRLCTRLNLMNKQDRIALFQAVLYGADYDASLNKVGPAQPRPELIDNEADEPAF